MWGLGSSWGEHTRLCGKRTTNCQLYSENRIRIPMAHAVTSSIEGAYIICCSGCGTRSVANILRLLWYALLAHLRRSHTGVSGLFSWIRTRTWASSGKAAKAGAHGLLWLVLLRLWCVDLAWGREVLLFGWRRILLFLGRWWVLLFLGWWRVLLMCVCAAGRWRRVVLLLVCGRG